MTDKNQCLMCHKPIVEGVFYRVRVDRYRVIGGNLTEGIVSKLLPSSEDVLIHEDCSAPEVKFWYGREDLPKGGVVQ